MTTAAGPKRARTSTFVRMSRGSAEISVTDRELYVSIGTDTLTGAVTKLTI